MTINIYTADTTFKAKDKVKLLDGSITEVLSVRFFPYTNITEYQMVGGLWVDSDILKKANNIK